LSTETAQQQLMVCMSAPEVRVGLNVLRIMDCEQHHKSNFINILIIYKTAL